MSRDARVNRKGEKPSSSPALDAELRRLKTARRWPAFATDRPPLSTLPGSQPKELPGQLSLYDSCSLPYSQPLRNSREAVAVDGLAALS